HPVGALDHARLARDPGPEGHARGPRLCGRVVVPPPVLHLAVAEDGDELEVPLGAELTLHEGRATERDVATEGRDVAPRQGGLGVVALPVREVPGGCRYDHLEVPGSPVVALYESRPPRDVGGPEDPP